MRPVESLGAVLASAVPSRVPSTGAARATSTTIAAISIKYSQAEHDECAPAPDQRLACAPASESSLSRRNGTFRRSIRWPISASRPGSRNVA